MSTTVTKIESNLNLQTARKRKEQAQLKYCQCTEFMGQIAWSFFVS
jgi:hypothetical protein